ncbi:MAG: beta-ketoacyl-ACP synthase III [Erysipelotrichaceae bacterium]
MTKIMVLGSAHYTPKQVMDNDMLSLSLDTSDEWIQKMTGIKTRCIASDEDTSDLAVAAVKALLQQQSINLDQIKVILVATFTPDRFTPSVACLVQAKLGWNHLDIMAFDINAACSGFVAGMQVASGLLEQDGDIALVIGAEKTSKLMDWTNRNTCILFGDGAGVVAIEKHVQGQVPYFINRSVGDLTGILATPPIQQIPCHLEMVGSEVFKFAVDKMPQAIDEVLAKAKTALDDVDLIIPHQANQRIISYVAKKYNLPMDRFVLNLDRYGNTSAASIPIALSEAERTGRVKAGMKILLVGFGAGFTYGAALLQR